MRCAEPVTFYVPREMPFEFPSNYDELDWEAAGSILGQGGHVLQAAWLFQTGIRLRSAGWDVQFVREFPTSGIVVSTVWDLPRLFRPPPEVVHVCVLGDGYPYMFADIYVSQNPVQATSWRGDRFVRPLWRYVPHWPQPDIRPRDAAHGSRFTRVGFAGHVQNLAPELQDAEWQAEFHANGFEWAESDLNQWHDYRNIDVSISCRRFTRRRYLNKPATKMYNAWFGGVPFIATPESAFVAERRTPDEAIFVHSPRQLLQALCSLRDDADRRQRMVQAGYHARERFSVARILSIWQQVLTDGVSRARRLRQKQGRIGRLAESMYFRATVATRLAESKLNQWTGGQR
ncbi:MAG TPA: hypothetical protein DCY89_08300 [Gammaproteobacteria bacterium]|nr:hypothetical protein [Gammaproteobacteria bacterium]